MNVWEFLGLPSDHRPEDKTVQLVRHWDDVEKKIKFPVLGQRKYDGIYCMEVCNNEGNRGIFGRTGRELTRLQLIKNFVAIAYICS
jgi:hypothetical protein